MKCLLTFTLVALVSVALNAQEPKTETSRVAWFDMENCDICKSMSHDKDMMEHVKWETHIIPDGFLAVSVIPDKYKESMAKAKKQMKAVMEKMEDGEDVKCCGYCQSMGALMAAGAKMKEISTVAGEIMLVTSNDEKVVEQIQAHAKQTIAEHKKMMEQLKFHQEKQESKGG